MLFKTLSIN